MLFHNNNAIMSQDGDGLQAMQGQMKPTPAFGIARTRLRCGLRSRPMTMPLAVVICWSRVYTRLDNGATL